MRARGDNKMAVAARRGAGYHHVTMTDARGRVLAYAEAVGVRRLHGREGTVGLRGITVAPDAVGRLFSTHLPELRIATHGVTRMRLREVRLAFVVGEERVATGERAYSAAIGVFRSLVPIRPRPPHRKLLAMDRIRLHGSNR